MIYSCITTFVEKRTTWMSRIKVQVSKDKLFGDPKYMK